MIQRLSIQYKTLLVLLLAAGIWGGYAYVSIAMRSEVGAINLTTLELARMLNRETARASARSAAYEIESISGRIDSFFIPADGAAAFIERLEALGEHAGTTVTIESVGIEQPAKPATEQKPVTEDFTLIFRVEGTWEPVFHFLTLLETMPYALAFDRVAFEHTAQAGEGGRGWRGSFSIRVKKLAGAE